MEASRPDAPGRESLQIRNEILSVSVDTPFADIAPLLPGTRDCEITIENFADGRGFSLVRLASGVSGFKGRLRVTGDIILDQVEAYFRCGADEVVSGGRLYRASDAADWAARPRYQRTLRDRPGIDVLIPERRRR